MLIMISVLRKASAAHGSPYMTRSPSAVDMNEEGDEEK
jgi:hypothetical protein